MLIKYIVYMEGPQEDQSLDRVRADELHDPLAVEIPSDDDEEEES